MITLEVLVKLLLNRSIVALVKKHILTQKAYKQLLELYMNSEQFLADTPSLMSEIKININKAKTPVNDKGTLQALIQGE